MYAACTTTFCHGGALMPYGGNDWLALTQEPTLEPELPICDPHHHFWDGRTDRIPYQRYLLHELVADVHCGHNVRSTVFIEARAMYRPDGPIELRPVGEVEFVQGLAAASASGLYGPCRAAAALIGRPRADHHPEPSGRLDAGRPVRPPERRGAANLAAGPGGRGGVSQRLPQARGDRHAPSGV